MHGRFEIGSCARSARDRHLALASIAIAVGVTLAPSEVRADETTDYCRKVTSQAQSEAAILIAPSISAQIIRYPASNVADVTGLQVGKGVQPRASMTWGVADMYRGLGVLDVADADCKRQQVAVQLQEIVLQRADLGRLPGLEAELTFLREKKPEVDALFHDAEERLAARTTTVVEVFELRKTIVELDQKTFEAEREAAVLKRRGFRTPSRPLTDVLNSYDERSLEYEKSLSHVRKVQAWKLDLSGGIATSPVVDYFAVASLTYNFGGLFQGPAETDENDARERELKNARYELRQQIETTLAELTIEVEKTREEIRAFDTELARIDSERAALDEVDAPNKASVLATLKIEAISLGADRAFLDGYATALASFGGPK